jgi:hypothetical protein
MGYEIDFLGVGEESKSGDAIAIRFGNLHGARRSKRSSSLMGVLALLAQLWLSMSEHTLALSGWIW